MKICSFVLPLQVATRCLLRQSAYFTALIVFSMHSVAANSPAVSAGSEAVAGYASLDAYAATSTRWSWDGDKAVAKRTFSLRFVRNKGWYIVENDEYTETHTWRDEKGCHVLTVDVRSQPQGFYQQRDSSCDPSAIPPSLSPSLEIAILSWLMRVPSGFLALSSCITTVDTLNCKQKNLRLTAELKNQRLSRAHFTQSEGDAEGNVSSVEFVESVSVAASLKLAPDLAALGLINMALSDTPTVILARAGKGDLFASRQVLMLLATGQLPEPTDPTQLHLALETLYRAKIVGADYFSAQLYAKAAAPYRATPLKQWPAAKLRAEFQKRMTEAAMACNVAALSRMEEGCLESGCENDTPQAAIALLSYNQQQSCERKQAQRFSTVKRPPWTQKALP